MYTTSMEHLVDRAIARNGRALIIDLHSYPLAPHHYENPTRRRPEICIGADHHTPDALLTAALNAFSPGYDTAINEPYAGTYVPGRHYQGDTPVASIMIEIRRDMLRTQSRRRRIVAAIDTMLTAASQR
jgi:N-formylglutamate amidohydrolase